MDNLVKNYRNNMQMYQFIDEFKYWEEDKRWCKLIEDYQMVNYERNMVEKELRFQKKQLKKGETEFETKLKKGKF